VNNDHKPLVRESNNLSLLPVRLAIGELNGFLELGLR
jgi:hypothetical protein